MRAWACMLTALAGAICHAGDAAGGERADPAEAGRTVAVLVGGRPEQGGIADFLQPEAWLDRRLPRTAEDVVIRRSAKLAKRAKFFRELGSLSVESAAALQIQSRLMMRGDVRINGNVEVNNGSLVVGGRLLLGSGDQDATLAFSLADDNPFPLVNCAAMDVGGKSAIEMAWWYTPPPESPGNSTPMIRVRGQLNVMEGARLSLLLKGFAEGYELPRGDYLLLGADRLTGNLPTLTIPGWPEASRPAPILVLTDDGCGIVLRVQPPGERR